MEEGRKEASKNSRKDGRKERKERKEGAKLRTNRRLREGTSKLKELRSECTKERGNERTKDR